MPVVDMENSYVIGSQLRDNIVVARYLLLELRLEANPKIAAERRRGEPKQHTRGAPLETGP